MATLVFSTVGTALGGPLGGALGALVGNQLDRAIIGSPKREGSRLRELAVTTSSYGTPIARHYGTVRTPGSVIWSTDLQESKEKSGGPKGSPAIATYAYSVSFAVALASRPIDRIGRIWADGSLLRGAASDLKVGGQLRIYTGYGDQDPDPLIESDRGLDCPAFRNVAYCVFEDLQLAPFGNRVPSLTFEVIADDGSVSIADVTAELGHGVSVTRPLTELFGFSNEGGPLSASLEILDQLYPMTCNSSQDVLIFAAVDIVPPSLPLLSEPVVDPDHDSFGGLSGKQSRRQNDRADIPSGLRYYDLDRDYQAGLQRAGGRARAGSNQVLEFPGVMQAATARSLCNALVQRASWSGDEMLWRIAEVDPALAAGQVVKVPDHEGAWRIEGWEWNTSGVELELRRLPPGPVRSSPADAGEFLAPKDMPAAPTLLVAYELPWNGQGSGNERSIYAATSSTGDGWTGAALYAEEQGVLTYLQPSGTRRCTVGVLTQPLPPAQATILDRHSALEVQLASPSFALIEANCEELAAGANRALVGEEIVQFANAAPLGGGTWRLTGLLRGRGGTESTALAGQAAGALFVLLDDRSVLLNDGDPALATTKTIAAIGLVDDVPVLCSIANSGLSRKPLTPVHPRFQVQPDGSWRLSWVRRARGAWAWQETGEVALGEQDERYLIGVGDSDVPGVSWRVTQPWLDLASTIVLSLRSNQTSQQVWVRQIGTSAMSDPLLLCAIQ